jgi:hypothetical protein
MDDGPAGLSTTTASSSSMIDSAMACGRGELARVGFAVHDRARRRARRVRPRSAIECYAPAVDRSSEAGCANTAATRARRDIEAVSAAVAGSVTAWVFGWALATPAEGRTGKATQGWGTMTGNFGAAAGSARRL